MRLICYAYTQESTAAEQTFDDGPRTDGFIRHCFQRLRIEILIAFRDYGFVDHVELIPPSQLLRVPSHPPGRSVLVDYPELHLAPSRILDFTTVIILQLLRFYHFTLAFSLASVPLQYSQMTTLGISSQQQQTEAAPGNPAGIHTFCRREFSRHPNDFSIAEYSFFWNLGTYFQSGSFYLSVSPGFHFSDHFSFGSVASPKTSFRGRHLPISPRIFSRYPNDFSIELGFKFLRHS